MGLPFATGSGPMVGPQQRRGTVVLRQEPDTGAANEVPVRLEQLAVSSNSTGMVHTEEMYDLGVLAAAGCALPIVASTAFAMAPP